MKNIISNFNVGQRLMLLVGIAMMAAVILTSLGIYGISKSNENIKTLYADRMVPTADLSKIQNLMLENRTFLRIALSEVKIGSVGKNTALLMNRDVAAKSADSIEQNIATISMLWKNYISTYLNPKEAILADNFSKARGQFVNEGLKPAIAALRADKYEDSKRYSEKVRDLYVKSGPHLEALIKLQFDIAAQEYQAGVERYENTRLFSIAILVVAMSLLAWLGFLITRSITAPLEEAKRIFGKIAEGYFDTPIEIKAKDELSTVLQGLKDMQLKLNTDISTQQALALKVKEQSTAFEGQLAAIGRSTGVIEFSMDGKVITANDLFLNMLGYSLNEAVGQPHSRFVNASQRESAELRQFWEKLNRGEAITGQFLRIGKDGNEVWLEASYNPILCAEGKPFKIVKYATDITAHKIRNADFEGQINAIGQSQGVIEISLDGKVLKVNETYLNMLGYAENELLGQQVSMVLDPTFAKSAEYAGLWDKLVKGGNDSGQYKRIGKGGKEVWIQASYNPIYDLNGKPFKIVNYTIDITEQKLQAADYKGQISGINLLQGIIEFDLTGKILTVNENFANVTGYSDKEIVGNHHSMFVEPAYRTSHEYKAFWEKLNRGEADIGQFKRIGKGGKEIWLQAIYNPIKDTNGKPFKVVKYATDITEQHKASKALELAVQETQNVIEGAKAGNLTSRVSLAGKTGAIASLCDGINALMDKMTEVIIQVREAGETINTAAGEISSGNTDLSSRTEQQASSLEETASSMEELASTVKQNAENAKQANQLAASASDIALKGGEVVGKVVSTMSAINQSSRKIENIISVIDGIAFQTNILALNAAVEAARAGEQGRGFAVVASEVRNLAQRSAGAAKEIKELIADSASKTAEGTILVENAGKTMQEIVSSVQRVTDIMGEIAAASAEQSAGIDQVNNAITSMDEVTQQNAALVEQAAAAAESLVDQAVSLIDVVNAFQLSNSKQTNNYSGNRRQTSSPMREASAYSAKLKPSSGKMVRSIKKTPIRTGTDDSWEEF